MLKKYLLFHSFFHSLASVSLAGLFLCPDILDILDSACLDGLGIFTLYVNIYMYMYFVIHTAGADTGGLREGGRSPLSLSSGGCDAPPEQKKEPNFFAFF